MRTLTTKIYIAFQGYENYGPIAVLWEYPVLPSIGETLSLNTLFNNINISAPDFARGMRQSIIRRVLWTKIGGETAPIFYLSV